MGLAVAAIAFLVVQPIGSVETGNSEDIKKTTLQVMQPSEEEIVVKTTVSIGSAIATTESEEQSEEQKKTATNTPKNTSSTQSTNTTTSNNSRQDTSQSSTQNASAEDSSANSYILPDSNKRLLTENDIEGMSAKELNYAKNEIYARHGRMFKSSELQNYFKSKSWYKEVYAADDFDDQGDSILSETERKNIEFLRDAEYALKPGGYQPA